MTRREVVFLLGAPWLAAACQRGTSIPASSPTGLSTPTPGARMAARARIVCLGDSLTAGYGLEDPAQAYPALLQARLDRKGWAFEVVNAGVSGDTSAAGLRRLDWSLAGDVRVVVIALGANDSLRGLAVDELRRNLDALVTRALARRARVLLAGMEAPPNMGPAYTGAFRAAFGDVARAHAVTLLPFLLEGVAGRPEFNQGDSIHPNAAGTRVVAENVWRALVPLLGPPPAARAQP
jgi:acyl-CoA thioesterase-1